MNSPKTDEDQPIEYHINELLLRLLIVASVSLSISLFILPFTENIVNYLWNSHIPNSSQNRPIFYSPISLIVVRIQVMILVSICVAFPILLYQLYKFMEPGMYDIEEKYFKLSSAVSFVLSLFGILVSNYIIIPIMFFYFTSYTNGVAEVAYGLQETIGLIVISMIYTVIIFQIPILILLAVSVGLISTKWLRSKRLLIWGVFFGISFLTSPDPTGFLPLILGFIMLSLFELTLFTIERHPISN